MRECDPSSCMIDSCVHVPVRKLPIVPNPDPGRALGPPGGDRGSSPIDGVGWQRYCHCLFTARHGERYQPVPDRVRGDWGIEGFTASGILYQCFAPEEPITREERHDKIRKKDNR
jgi:hypothetical protein